MSATEQATTGRFACRLCTGTAIAEVLGLEPTPPGNALVAAIDRDEPQDRFPLTLVLCEGCGHVQLADVVATHRLFPRDRSAVAAQPAAAAYVQSYARQLVDQFQPGKDALVVGVGSNDGTMLQCFKDAGLRPQGVEPAVDLARDAIAAGIPTFPGWFSAAIASRIEEERGRAVMVVATDSFAEAENPDAFLRGVQRLLTRDGVFAFEVPYLFDLVEDRAIDLVCHQHPNYYAVGPLVRFFHSRDMELIAAERAPGRRGRLRGIARRLGASRRVDDSVSILARMEASAGLADVATYGDLAADIAAARRTLAAMLADIRRKDRGVAGYGASAGATTLCHQLALGGDALDFVVDDTEWRQGLLTPGLHLPVLAPAALYERRPRAVVILLRERAAEIMADHRGYADAGGRFILPLPEPHPVLAS